MQPGLRTRPGEREAVTTAGFTVDPVARKAVRDGRLTPNDWHLPEFLTGNPGPFIPQRQLLQEIRGLPYSNTTNCLRACAAQLRRRLDPDPSRPRCLITEPG
ncbi:winged helix-turn-helix domain-containing protein [Streptomyces sp. NBC_00154]|uniref:winged helix-turn-helix domain-containing protein n=1 Tax=Streptomyces sp. NBC_00154 TaxID=2975670 RepID=UPI00225489F5|nr:winged helix-turn-helix domain-containing protein [Streptomyces sp. NBC_00154]MCX5314692.1 winged helix-turn-helix domain-containing protein [Streptomyces sp. NBC_00154]